MLLAELPSHLDQIQADYERDDLAALQKSVHKLNGAASVCQVEPLRAAADQLESVLRQKSKTALADAYQALIAEIESLLTESSPV